MIPRILENDEVIPFVSQTEKYGRAEFAICTKYEHGKLVKTWITPQQQPDAKETFLVETPYGADNLSIYSWSHKGMDDPRVWIHGWCPEHDCPFFRVYVPVHAKNFSVSKLSSLCITFDNEEKA